MCGLTYYRIISYVTILFHIICKFHNVLNDPIQLISINYTLLYNTKLFHTNDKI